MLEIRNLNDFDIEIKTYGKKAIEVLDSDGSIQQIPCIELMTIGAMGGTIIEGDVGLIKIYPVSDDVDEPAPVPVGGD